jgi:hypothetical protein
MFRSLLTRRVHLGPGDAFTGAPAQGVWPKWFGGIFVPLAMGAFGVFSIWTERSYLAGRSGGMRLDGKDAILMGVVSLSLGVFLHCHYFWGNLFLHSNLAELGKIVSLTTFVGALVTLIFRLMWF